MRAPRRREKRAPDARRGHCHTDSGLQSGAAVGLQRQDAFTKAPHAPYPRPVAEPIGRIGVNAGQPGVDITPRQRGGSKRAIAFAVRQGYAGHPALPGAVHAYHRRGDPAVRGHTVGLAVKAARGGPAPGGQTRGMAWSARVGHQVKGAARQHLPRRRLRLRRGRRSGFAPGAAAGRPRGTRTVALDACGVVQPVPTQPQVGVRGCFEARQESIHQVAGDRASKASHPRLGQGITIDNRAGRLAVVDTRLHRVGEHQREGLAALVVGVVEYPHLHVLRPLPRVEDEGARCRNVVRPGRCRAIDGGEVNPRGRFPRAAQVDPEIQGAALVSRIIGNGECG